MSGYGPPPGYAPGPPPGFPGYVPPAIRPPGPPPGFPGPPIGFPGPPMGPPPGFPGPPPGYIARPPPNFVAGGMLPNRPPPPPALVSSPFVPAAEKSTIVYVGKIAPTLDDDVVSSLLNACGTVKSWKRQEDPSTKEKKGFGFCEYEDADGCLRAIRLLNGLKVDAQELLLKANTITKVYIDEYEANKMRERQQSEEEKMERAKAKQEEGEVLEEAEEDDEQAQDNKILEKVMGIVSEREEKFQKTLPPPPPLPQSMKQATGTRESKGSARSTDLDREELLHARERELRKEEERERREEEERRKELDRIYETRVREWERAEKDNAAMRGKERDRERALEADRRKIIHLELEEAPRDPDLSIPLWARKPISLTRRSMDRRKRRAQEEQDDDDDRQREQTQGPFPLRRPWYEVLAAEVAEKKRRRQEEMEMEESAKRLPSSAVNEQEDSIMAAMMAAAQRPQATPPAPLVAPAIQKVAAFFVDDDDDKSAPRRTLRPLEYTEEELRALKEPMVAEGEGGQAVAEGGGKETESDRKARLDKILASIPSTRDGIWSYPVKWAAYDSATMKDKLTKWVAGKVKDLLGMPEDSLVKYVIELLENKAPPQKMMDELSPVLDADTESFCLKLYRVVIFETESRIRPL